MNADLDAAARRGEHPLQMWAPLTVRVDGGYEYRLQSRAAKWARAVLYRVIRAIFPPAFRLVYGLRVRGRENLEGAQGGVVTVCNHIHPLDCVMVACALRGRQTYFVSLKSNLEIPVIGCLVRLLGALPLPETASGAVKLSRTVHSLLDEGAAVQIYPEGALHPYCGTLRPFKRGAFAYAAEAGAPVLPMVLRPCPRRGWRRFTGRRPLLELIVLPPRRSEMSLGRRARAAELESRVRSAMESALQGEEA